MATKRNQKRQARGAVPSKKRGTKQTLLPAIGKWSGRGGLLLLALGLCYAASRAVASLEVLPVQRVMFAGEFQRVDRQIMIERTKPLIGGGFLALDLEAIRTRLEAEPWVYSVRISRQWPRELQITVQEEAPIARWGEEFLINHKGELFAEAVRDSSGMFAELPILNGPSGSELEVVNAFWAFSQQLRAAQLAISRLELTAQREWQIELGNTQLLLLPEGNSGEKLSLFTNLYREYLQENFDRVARLDMRYQQGLAVAWRE